MTADGPVDILLVEDNLDDLELITLALNRCGFGDALHAVRDGEEALEFLFTNRRYAGRAGRVPPRFVLLDIKLPLIDGLEVLRRLKSDPRTRRIPVVLMTSSGQDRDLAAAYENGANSYLIKPVDFERFTKMLGSCATYWLKVNTPPAI